ncbi:hypothetical protein D1159_00325 [Pseudoflavonifractor sp. 524-17]|nr:hypothetical protein [Pseudoflavonifractor sp. 524-17]
MERVELSAEARSRTERNFFRCNGWTVAWYVFLTVAGVLLYKLGAAYAMQERGYFAVGGEALALLLPVLYYCAAATVRDIIKDWRERR